MRSQFPGFPSSLLCGIFQKDKATESFTFLTSVVSPLTSQAKGTIQHCGTVTKNHEDLTQCPLESYEPPQCRGPAMSNGPVVGLSAWLMLLLVIWDPGVGSTRTKAHETQSTHPEPTRLEEGSGEPPYMGLDGHRLHPSVYSGSKGQQRGRQSCSGDTSLGTGRTLGTQLKF